MGCPIGMRHSDTPLADCTAAQTCATRRRPCLRRTLLCAMAPLSMHQAFFRRRTSRQRPCTSGNIAARLPRVMFFCVTAVLLSTGCTTTSSRCGASAFVASPFSQPPPPPPPSAADVCHRGGIRACSSRKTMGSSSSIFTPATSTATSTSTSPRTHRSNIRRTTRSPPPTSMSSPSSGREDQWAAHTTIPGSSSSSRSSTEEAILPELNHDEVRRYSRHLILPEVGVKGQRRLKGSSVLAVGTGGLGSPALLYLAAAGVGRLGIVDDDVVDESNLQRQV